jgi:hypothetical protein
MTSEREVELEYKLRRLRARRAVRVADALGKLREARSGRQFRCRFQQVLSAIIHSSDLPEPPSQGTSHSPR